MSRTNVKENLMTSTVVFTVDGMQCDACAARLQNALYSRPGVQQSAVSFKDRQARVVFDPAETNPNHLEKAIHDAGFTTPAGCR